MTVFDVIYGILLAYAKQQSATGPLREYWRIRDQASWAILFILVPAGMRHC